MRRPTEDDLILYYYGEAKDPEAIRHHLASDAADRARYEALQRLLDALPEEAIPERPDSYGARVWAGIAPEIRRRGEVRSGGLLGRWLAPLTPRRLAAAGALVALLAAAFAAGRLWPRPVPPETSGERVLLAAVREHLDRTEILLLEVMNAPGGSGEVLHAEHGRAAELAAASRRYEGETRQAGYPAVAGLLEVLEEVLADVAASPEDGSDAALARLRREIEDRDLMFKVWVVGTRLESEDGPGAKRKGAST